MNKSMRIVVLAGIVLLAFSVMAGAGASDADGTVKRMEIQELVARIDSPSVVIIDVRRGKDWDASELMIKNAFRREYADVASWKNDLPGDRAIVLYCA